MEKYSCYEEISPNRFQRKNEKGQYIIMALLLWAIGGWLFGKASISGYVSAGFALIAGFLFIARMFSQVVIDLNDQTILAKAGLFSAPQKVDIATIESFAISNRIYVLLLISSGFAIVHKANKQQRILIGQYLMTKNKTEQLLLETEKILGGR